MEDDAADHLNVEVAHANGAFASFADDGEGFRQDGVECFLFGGDALVCILWGVGDVCDGCCYALAELGGLIAQSLVGERLNGRLERVNLRDGRLDALHGAFVTGAKDFCND